MIRKQKKLLFNFFNLTDTYFFLIVGVSILTAVFFWFAVVINQQFFGYILVCLAVCIVYLFIIRQYLSKEYAVNELRMRDLEERININTVIMNKSSAVISSLRKKIVNFDQMKEVMENLNKCLYVEDTSKILSLEVKRLLGDEETKISLYLFHSRTGELGASFLHKGQMRMNREDEECDFYDRWVIKSMSPLIVEDTQSDYRFSPEENNFIEHRSVISLISIPLMIGNKMLGILRVDSVMECKFTTADLRVLQTIGDLGSIAIENAQLYENVERLAICDGLTGLYLRKYLFDCIPQEIERSKNQNEDISFVMIDLDKFKKYNDEFGHTAGDIVLKIMGRVLKESFCDEGMLVCRFGGEEFCVLLSKCAKARAQVLAEEFRRKIETETIILRRKKTNITVSIGVASFPMDANDKDDLVRFADEALYRAKALGRNRVCVI